jgi:type I restriction enzyme, R subunit
METCAFFSAAGPHDAGQDRCRRASHSEWPGRLWAFRWGTVARDRRSEKVTVNPQNVLEQAKRYARAVFAAAGEWNGFRVPFLYASNGTLIWHVDARPRKLVSRQLSDFHTPEAVEERFAKGPAAANYLLDTPPEQLARLRPYQRDCILAVEQAILGGKHDMMVAMATGTGKTFLTVAQIYRLLESKLVRRILFLVDRRALAAQAVREFNPFNTPKGNKFTQEYEVYSQRFQREDLDEDARFDPRFCQTST